MRFRFEVARFRFTALDAVRFPAGKAANVFRGALGLALREVAGEREYTRLFAPRSSGAGPSGLADAPRPFVLRVRELDGARLEPGAPFACRLHLFDTRDPALETWRAAFSAIARTGFGPGRGRARLESVETQPVELSLEAQPRGATQARVSFLSPTELKGQPAGAGAPQFAVLLARCRDRLSTLGALYGAGGLEIDFRGLGARAAAVVVVRSNLRHVDLERRSGRTGQVHPIGGMTGEVEYAGALDEFLPYLEAAAWTGVGRQTVWGKGEISVEAR